MYLRIRNLFFQAPDDGRSQNNIPDGGKANNQEFHQISIYGVLIAKIRIQCSNPATGLFFCIIQVLMVSLFREIKSDQADQRNDSPGNDAAANKTPAPALLKKIQKKQIQ